MILTVKIKHKQNLSSYLEKGRQVALVALKTRSRTSKDVKHIGLPSAISNQILKKYSSNKKLKKISSVKLTLPSQSIKLDKNKIRISCLKLELNFEKETSKIHQIELDEEYAYVSYLVKEENGTVPKSWIGVDLNATGHCCVAGNPATGKTWKLGKCCQHVHKKYKNLRRYLQKRRKYQAVKKIKNKESRIIKDINHKISNKVIQIAKNTQAGVVLEDLKEIRKTAKTNKKFKYALHSWSFYQLRMFIEYKAKLHGVTVVKIDPRYTSQQCSKCGLLGERNGKIFKCSCGHVENADVNASFVISLRHQGVLQFSTDRDVEKGLLASPKRIVA
jgi:putative transposase